MRKSASHTLATLGQYDAVKGNFCIDVRKGTAWVPKDILAFCQERMISTLEGLLSLAWHFPSEVTAGLGWDDDHVWSALIIAAQCLQGVVDDSYLQPPSAPSPSAPSSSAPCLGGTLLLPSAPELLQAET